MTSLLSIVVPVFNEAGSVEPLYQEIVEALTPLGAFEVVFVDDGSTDGSSAVIERLVAAHDCVRLVKLRRNFGKAAALTHGFAEARGDLIVTMDGDRQDDPAEIPKLLAKLDQGYDLVSGWKQSRQDPVSKTLPSKFFNWTVRKSTGVALHDFNCGLKAYRREVTRHVTVYGELHRYIPVLASDLGFRVAEEKVSHRRRTAGQSKYGWRRYARGYLDLLTVLFLGRYRQRPQHLFGGIGTMMVLAGVLVDLYLTIDKLFGHPIGQRPLLVFGTLLIIVGIQLLSLGLVGELITQARARDKPDDYEVERVVEAPASTAANRVANATRPAVLPAPGGPTVIERTTPAPELSPAPTRPSL
jgi:glycosyltransferase involved in cell wall biosynthesis